MSDELSDLDMLEFTASIASAYVSNNSVPANGLTDLITSVHASLVALQQPATEPQQEQAAPAVPVKKSIAEDHLVCLEDGKRFKSLKRHLSADHGLTPEQYRARWNLPANYPMVAPSYAAIRSALAKNSGLGRKAGDAPAKKVGATGGKVGRPKKPPTTN